MPLAIKLTVTGLAGALDVYRIVLRIADSSSQTTTTAEEKQELEAILVQLDDLWDTMKPTIAAIGFQASASTLLPCLLVFCLAFSCFFFFALLLYQWVHSC